MSIVATELKHKAEESEFEKKEAFEDQAASVDEANPEHIEITFCNHDTPGAYSIAAFIKDYPELTSTLQELHDRFWYFTKDKMSFIVYILSRCARDGLVDIARNIFLRDQEFNKYLDSIKNKPIVLKGAIWTSSTLLGTAVDYGRFNFVKFLIEEVGYDVNASGREGHYPLEELFLKPELRYSLNRDSEITEWREIAKYLLSRGACDYRYLVGPIRLHPCGYPHHEKPQELHFKKGEIISPHIIQSRTTLKPYNQKVLQYREMILREIEDFIASRNQHIEQIIVGIYGENCNPKFIKHILEYLTEPHLLLKQNKFAQDAMYPRNSLCSRINNHFYSNVKKYIFSMGSVSSFWLWAKHVTPALRELIDSNTTLKYIALTVSVAPPLILLFNNAYMWSKEDQDKRTLKDRIKKRTQKLAIETDEGKIEPDEEKIETEIASANAKSHKKRV